MARRKQLPEAQVGPVDVDRDVAVDAARWREVAKPKFAMTTDEVAAQFWRAWAAVSAGTLLDYPVGHRVRLDALKIRYRRMVEEDQ
jgi:hypothetical protein